jgi:ketosteroid isomerase-like protein
LKTTGFDPQSLLIDENRVAMLVTLSAIVRETGRKVSYRVAHFLRFRNDKVFEFRSIIDSLTPPSRCLAIRSTCRSTEPTQTPTPPGM